MRKARFWRKREDKVLCELCPHSCLLGEGELGLCGVRVVKQGQLWTLNYGKVVAAHLDPIEKKPLYHFLPGTASWSIAAPGCNLRCLWCQNWEISQLPLLYPGWEREVPEMSSKDVVRRALELGASTIAYTYTEPTVFYEFAADTMVLAAEAGLRNVWVTNGFINPKPLQALAGLLHAANVDLKTSRVMEEYTGGRVRPVMQALKLLKAMGVWVEVTTLVVPGVNDSDEDLRSIARFIRDELGPGTPWHVSRFWPAYKAGHIPPTPPQTVLRAYEIGREEGLYYVYPGNLPAGELEDTCCPRCGHALVRRRGFWVEGIDITPDGRCPRCGREVEGVWK